MGDPPAAGQLGKGGVEGHMHLWTWWCPGSQSVTLGWHVLSFSSCNMFLLTHRRAPAGARGDHAHSGSPVLPPAARAGPVPGQKPSHSQWKKHRWRKSFRWSLSSFWIGIKENVPLTWAAKGQRSKHKQVMERRRSCSSSVQETSVRDLSSHSEIFFPLKTQYKALLTKPQPVKRAGRNITDSFIPKLNLLRTKQKNVCRDLTSFVVRVILTKVNVTLTTARFTLIGVQNKENPCNATKHNKAPNRSSFKRVTHDVALLPNMILFFSLRPLVSLLALPRTGLLTGCSFSDPWLWPSVLLEAMGCIFQSLRASKAKIGSCQRSGPERWTHLRARVILPGAKLVVWAEPPLVRFQIRWKKELLKP